VVFDSNFLVAATEPELVPKEKDDRAKFQLLLRSLDEQKTHIIIPTPVLAEVLMKRFSERARLIQALRRSPRITLAEFGAAAAAVSAELMARKWPKPSDRSAEWSRHRLKFDLQIVAIAQVNNAAVVYTTDKQLAAHCRTEGMAALGFADLPMPDVRQSVMDLIPPSAATAGAGSGAIEATAVAPADPETG
jgi:predicted nucleic acid-binding protein